ncbi:MAG: hypothetical protein M5U11_10570 [Anaerolineales bacterium]|jgi:hypothetical protein|nr:hypothetical protein [Anaerolineales bacterium]MDX9936386.1 hypothetical protein [Anaerolineales bacterium]GER80208.1 conserved hypothetical protein [Candidatus Denitrolinea symbiosum]
MEVIAALINTPASTLLIFLGAIFIFIAIATIKKPIIIDIKPPSNRKLAFIVGVILIGAGIYLLTLQIPEQSPDTSVTATPIIESPTFTASPQPILSITDTPSPMSVSFFENDCINSDIWTPTPFSKSRKIAGNCWDLSDNGFKVADGNLFISIQNKPPVSGTMSMSVLETSSIKFDVKIDNFATGENNNLAFGVGTSDGWLTAGEFIFYRLTESKIYVVQGTSVVEYGRDTINNYKIGSVDTLEFQLNKLSFDIYLNGAKVASNLALPDSPFFWIGYRVAENAKINAVISNFSIQE